MAFSPYLYILGGVCPYCSDWVTRGKGKGGRGEEKYERGGRERVGWFREQFYLKKKMKIK